MDRRRLMRRLAALLLALAWLPAGALAHEGHDGHDSGGESGVPIGAILLGVGLASVAGAIAVDRYQDVPREYAGVVALGGLGVAVGGIAIVLL